MPDFELVHAIYDDAVRQLTAGGLFDGVDIEFTVGDVFQTNRTVADEFGNDVLWSTGAGGFDSFELGLIISSRDLIVELRNDNGTPAFVTFVVKANVPYYFGPELGTATAAAIDGAEIVDNTDYDTVDQVAVQNNALDGEGDAEVTLWLFK